MYSSFSICHQKKYEKKLKELKEEWDAVFEEYYMKEIHSEVHLSIGRWILEKKHMYNPYSGITNNQSEGFNRYKEIKSCHYPIASYSLIHNWVYHHVIIIRVLKDLQEWKEAPLDCIILSLYQLQAFYSNEIKRGLAGLGEYTITPEYRFLQIDSFSVEYMPASTPEDIVKSIREGRVQKLEEGIEVAIIL